MKKILFTIIIASLAGMMNIQAADLMGTISVNGQPVSATYRQLSANTVALGTGRNACVSHYISGFVSVPGSVDIGGTHYTVTEVSDLAFRLCQGITGVEFGEGITRVGAFAFTGCPAVSEITLPESMQSLGSGAFQSCLKSLRSVTCKGTTPPRWEYNDVFVFHKNGIGDNAAGVITAATKLYVPNEEVYRAANYTDPSLGWTTADGWGSFSYVHLGQATFHIDSPAKLQVLHEIVNVGHMYGQIGSVQLDADIDMSGYQWSCGMGVSEEEAFEASFYGNGHTISNLTIDTDNYGGFFAHYGGHYLCDVTFKNCTFKCDRADLTQYPNGVLGCVVGECGALIMRNVCLDNCNISSAFKTNGLLMGRCLTAGGAAFYNCVIKDCNFVFTATEESNNGDLVGECYGGSANDCAIFNNDTNNANSRLPFPFVGKCATNAEFNVNRCYNTRQYFGGTFIHPTSSDDYQPADNVKYSHVVLDKDRAVHYKNEEGAVETMQFYLTTLEPAKSAYFRTLFMIPELGLDHWIFQEGEYPVPAEMAHLFPEPQVNRMSFCPKAFQSISPRLNCLSPKRYITDEEWCDMDPETGYRSKSFIASRLWIDDNFNPENPSLGPYSVHNPILPIGTASITAINGIAYDRVLSVTHDGTAGYTLPVAVLDEQGKPVYDEDGFIVTDGEMTLYEYDTYKSTDYTLYLPYTLNVNGGARVYQPVGVRHDNEAVIIEMKIVDDGVIKPWTPYYIMVNDASIKLSVDYEIEIEPRDNGVSFMPFEDGKYRMYGTVGRFTPDNDIDPYKLQEDDTWRIDHSVMLPFTCYIINQSGENVDHFSAVTQLSLGEKDENESLIAAYDGTVVDVVLEGRTFYKDGTWYTLCLPFDLESFAGTPLEGATVSQYSGADYNEEEGTLKINFTEVTSIIAGKPYLVKWEQAPRVVNPIFENVTIKNSYADINRIGSVAFAGTYSPVVLPGDNNQLLYLGDDNQLFCSDSPTQIKAFRGFFMLGNTLVNSPAGVKRVSLNLSNGTITAIDDISVQRPADPNWYSVDGRVLRDKPTVPGIYMHNGKKVLVK